MIDDEELSIGSHRLAAIAQDADALRVIPAVNDVLHDVAVRAVWHGVEEIAADAFATVGYVGCRDESALIGAPYDLRLVVEYAPKLLVSAQDRRQHMPVGASDIDK